MIDLSSMFRLAIGYYARPVTIQDTTYSATDGEDVQVVSGSARTVYAAVDSSSRQTMEYLFGGDVSDGDVLLYVPSTESIYIADLYTNGTRKQSYLTDGGTVYRVAGKSDVANPAGYYVYLCKRHVKQGVY